MKLVYDLKAHTADVSRHTVYVGRWRLGELVIRPEGVEFFGIHRASGKQGSTSYPSREAFEASLDDG